MRTGGALGQDVMLGRALALQRLGPSAAGDESRAWSALLTAYPGTVHSARAQRRLQSLVANPPRSRASELVQGHGLAADDRHRVWTCDAVKGAVLRHDDACPACP
jgi:hypothetical protein